MRSYLRIAAITVMFVFSQLTFAATSLMTSSADYTGPVLGLSPFSNGNYNFTFGPVSIPGGITFTAAPGNNGNSGLGSVIGQGHYGLASNGAIGDNATYIGLDSGTGFATLTFATDISSFGGFWNYAPDTGTPVISAYDASNSLLGTYDLSVLAPISTPNGFNQFVFRGIQSDSTDIKSIQFSGAYMVLTSAIPAIPEPGTYTMLLAGLGLIGFMARRRKEVVA